MMKWTLILSLVLLATIGLELVQAEHDQDLDLTEEEYLTLTDFMEDMADSDNEGDVRLSNWFKKAFNSAKQWTKKAASDTGNAFKKAGKWSKKALIDAGKAIKKGCGVVNEIPVKELVYHRAREMREEGFMADINEQQLAAAYGALKAGCKAVGKK